MRFVNFEGIRVDVDQVAAYQARDGHTVVRLKTLQDAVVVNGDVTKLLDKLLDSQESEYA
jgi:hypothetical protein